MKASIQNETITITRNDGQLIGVLQVCDVAHAGRLLEILNDEGPYRAGEMRKALVPVFIEMKAQGIDSMAIEVDGDDPYAARVVVNYRSFLTEERT